MALSPLLIQARNLALEVVQGLCVPVPRLSCARKSYDFLFATSVTACIGTNGFLTFEASARFSFLPLRPASQGFPLPIGCLIASISVLSILKSACRLPTFGSRLACRVVPYDADCSCRLGCTVSSCQSPASHDRLRGGFPCYVFIVPQNLLLVNHGG